MLVEIFVLLNPLFMQKFAVSPEKIRALVEEHKEIAYMFHASVQLANNGNARPTGHDFQKDLWKLILQAVGASNQNYDNNSNYMYSHNNISQTRVNAIPSRFSSTESLQWQYAPETTTFSTNFTSALSSFETASLNDTHVPFRTSDISAFESRRQMNRHSFYENVGY